MAVARADDVDLSAATFWSAPAAERNAAFRVLRDEMPVSWQRQPESAILPSEAGTGGYWAVTRHADVVAVSRNPDLFCSGQGVLFEDVPVELLEAASSFLATDNPRHAELRGLISSAFTPKQVKRIEAQIAANAVAVVDELLEHDECDFVSQVSRQLPMRTILSMWDIPRDDWDTVVGYVENAASFNDPDYLAGREASEVLFTGIFGMAGYAAELAAQRREHPGDDLMSGLVVAEVEGTRLSDEEIGAFFVMLCIAGTDTTRQTTSAAMRALCEYPAQRRWLAEDLEGRMPAAVEEFVRWATPIMTFRRTATQDTILNGQPVAEGDKVVMFYGSANRDERVFDHPDELDLSRTPNRHVGFGGGGPHYCMGAPIARTQLRLLFTSLLERAPRLQVGEPVPLIASFIGGIKSMPCQVHR